MAITLRDALEETMKGWQKALPEPWRPIFKSTTLDAKSIPLWLKHQPWVPIFPVFRNQATGEIFQAAPIPKPDRDKGIKSPNLVGLPYFAHTFRALLVPPDEVKVVVVGQDPYPDIKDATGQSFEQGSINDWVKDSHNVAGSLKPILQTAAAADRNDDKRYRVPWKGWTALASDIAAKKFKVAAPDQIFPAYQKQGILWLNTTLSISHFRVYPKGKPDSSGNPPGYQEAHASYWKPFVSQLFDHIVSRGEDKPVVFALFGTWAKKFKPAIKAAAEAAGNVKAVKFVETGHPVTKPFIERKKNPFVEINEKLAQLGEKTIKWLPK